MMKGTRTREEDGRRDGAGAQQNAPEVGLRESSARVEACRRDSTALATGVRGTGRSTLLLLAIWAARRGCGISLWYPLWEDFHCTACTGRRGTGVDRHAGMSRSVFAAPKAIMAYSAWGKRTGPVHVNHEH